MKHGPLCLARARPQSEQRDRSHSGCSEQTITLEHSTHHRVVDQLDHAVSLSLFPASTLTSPLTVPGYFLSPLFSLPTCSPLLWLRTMRRRGGAFALLLLLLCVQLAWGEQVSLSIPDALNPAQMGSVNSNADTAAPGAATTTGSLSISEAAKGTEAIPSVNDVSSAPFQLSDHKSVADALSAYAAWHNRTLADPAACKETGVLVWTATAVSGTSAVHRCG